MLNVEAIKRRRKSMSKRGRLCECENGKKWENFFMIFSVTIKCRVMPNIRFVPKNYFFRFLLSAFFLSNQPFLLILVNFQAHLLGIFYAMANICRNIKALVPFIYSSFHNPIETRRHRVKEMWLHGFIMQWNYFIGFLACFPPNIMIWKFFPLSSSASALFFCC